MKSILKKLVMLVSVIATSQAAIATDFYVDGFGYDIISAADLTCRLTDGSNATGDITIPEKVTYKGKELTVTSIGYKEYKGDILFSGCKSLTSVVLPTSITSIGERAFYGCSNLKSISIPNSVTYIGDYAFYGCQNLDSITIPNSVSRINSGAFYNCSENLRVDIPNSVSYIDKGAFGSIKEMTIVDGNKEITLCSEYSSATSAPYTRRPFNTSQLYIGRNMRLDTDGYGGSVLSPFTDKIEKLIIGGGTTFLPERLGWEYAKYVYDDPDDYYLPELYNYRCKLKYLEIQKGEGVLTLNFNIKSTEQLEVIINRDTKNGDYSICPNILRIGDNVVHYVSIDASRLQSVTFGKSMSNIPYNCLKGYNITTIYMRNPQPPTYTGSILQTTYTDATLYVPKGSLEAYQAAEPWKTFWDIQEIDMESGLDDITINTNKTKPDVSVDGNLMRIHNADGLTVSVYNPDGSQVWQTDSYTGDAVELLPGMHIVRVGNRAIKLAI